MAWYRAGTAAFTNGSTAVAGSGTAWATNVRPGDEIIGPDNISREVETVTSDTALTMVETYAGTTAAGAAYKVKPIQGWNRDVAAQLAALINDYGGIEAALAVVGGNVGIGTLSPASVAGYTNVTLNNSTNGGQLILQSNDVTAFNMSVDSSSVYLDSPTTRPIRFFTNGAERLRIDSAGNFGFGTASPTAALDLVRSGDGGLQFRTGTRTVGIGQVSGEASVYWGSGTRLSFFSGTVRGYVDVGGGWVLGVPASPPSLSTNNTVTFNLTSNTNLRISARGGDGVTRVANITLA